MFQVATPMKRGTGDKTNEALRTDSCRPRAQQHKRTCWRQGHHGTHRRRSSSSSRAQKRRRTCWRGGRYGKSCTCFGKCRRGAAESQCRKRAQRHRWPCWRREHRGTRRRPLSSRQRCRRHTGPCWHWRRCGKRCPWPGSWR